MFFRKQMVNVNLVVALKETALQYDLTYNLRKCKYFSTSKVDDSSIYILLLTKTSQFRRTYVNLKESV